MVRPALLAHPRTVTLLVVGTALLGGIGDALAQEIPENNIFGPTITTFRDSMAGVQGRLADLLTGIFIALATIEFAWAMAMGVLHDIGLQGIAREVVYRLVFIGFFAWLLKEGNGTVIDIVNDFRTLGARAFDTDGAIDPGAAATLAPDDMLDLGFFAAIEAYKGGSFWSPIDSTAVFFAALIILLAMIVVAAAMIVTLLEFYIVGYAGFVLLALGGSRWTSDFAVAYLKYAVSVGMKLFVLLVIAGLGYSIIRESIIGADYDKLSQLWVLLASSVLLAFLAWTVPRSILGLLTGVSTAVGLSPSQVTDNSRKAAESMTAAATQLGSAATALTAAARLGSVQSGSTGINAVKNLAKTAIADVSAKASGQRADGSIFPNHGKMPARMAASMNQDRKAIISGTKGAAEKSKASAGSKA